MNAISYIIRETFLPLQSKGYSRDYVYSLGFAVRNIEVVLVASILVSRATALANINIQSETFTVPG
jgi:hypothetical protein